MQKLYLLVPLAPLLGALIAGLMGRIIGPVWSHRITIALVFASLLASIVIFVDVLEGNTYNGTVYTWLVTGDARFEVGFLIDQLSAILSSKSKSSGRPLPCSMRLTMRYSQPVPSRQGVH